MVSCSICSSHITEYDQYYQFGNMGNEIISTIENNLGHEVDENGTMCAHCFANIMQTITASASVPYEEYELQSRCDTNVCVWCRSSLHMRRSHSLPEGPERHLISERIAPRLIPDGSLVCYACWVRVTRIRRQEGLPGTSRSQTIDSNICVWCLRSLIRIRSHSIPDGPERNEIITRIHPREIPPGGKVCYSCWVSACRNVQRAVTVAEIHQNQLPRHTHHNEWCALCGMALFRRQTHILSSGPERDAVAARIYPRELLEHTLLCSTCWTQTQECVQQEPVAEVTLRSNTMLLNEFTHTTSSSAHCFVPLCANSERLRVPDYIRKRILVSQKIFVMEHARICSEHKTLYNWEVLEQHEFSNSFTQNEMEAMLKLSIQEMNQFIDFENIQSIDENVFIFWTGVTKENYFNIYNIISPLLRASNPHTALGAYLIKVRTGDSHQRISSLLCVGKSSISRFLQEARDALLSLFVPLHLGLNHISRNNLMNKNLIIPEGLFGDSQNKVPIVICDGTYIYLQKSSNYLFQKKTYSLHKYRNLVKPFLLVATDGHIIDIFGPYSATESDADIMKALFQNEDGDLRTYFRENDVFILDRGFRDAIPFLESLGYKIHKPESLEQGEIQLPTIKANKSRYVTLCRWVVEVVNGRFKRDYKLFRQEYFNLAATHLMDDMRICASLINAFHPKIENRPDAEIILNRALERKEMPNVLANLIVNNRINRYRAQFTSINAQLPELDTFPEMTMADLIIFALGTYQIKQARSYYGEHVRQRGSFQVEVSDQLEVVTGAISSQQEDPILIRGRIKSRHHSGRAYYTYILMARQGIGLRWDERILSYYCSCISGQRTVGCCSHIMTIIWYLGWARHQDSITAPASFLDEILIRDDI